MPDPISAADKLKAIKREIGQRKFVYPKLVASGKMTQAKANHEIAVMEGDLYRLRATSREGTADLMVNDFDVEQAQRAVHAVYLGEIADREFTFACRAVGIDHRQVQGSPLIALIQAEASKAVLQ